MRYVKQAAWMKIGVSAVVLALLGVVQAQPQGGKKIRRLSGQRPFDRRLPCDVPRGEDAVVAIDGDDRTDLDLYVYDEDGNLIGSNIFFV